LKDSLLQSEGKEHCLDEPTHLSTMLLSNIEGVRSAVQKADVIVTATNTCVPLFSGNWVKPGCHINGVGSVCHKLFLLHPKNRENCSSFLTAN